MLRAPGQGKGHQAPWMPPLREAPDLGQFNFSLCTSASTQKGDCPWLGGRSEATPVKHRTAVPGQWSASVNVSSSLSPLPRGRVCQKDKMLPREPVYKRPRRLCAAPRPAHTPRRRPVSRAGWYGHHSARKWPRPCNSGAMWRLAIAPFAPAAASGLATFLLQDCSSVSALPTSQPPPTVPQRALSCPHTLPYSSVLDRRFPASGLVLQAPPGQPGRAACRACPSALLCACWLWGEPTLLPASRVASAALTCHRSPAFLGHLSVTPRRQGVLNLQGWTPVHVESPQGLLRDDTVVHPARLQPTTCEKPCMAAF